MAHVVDARLRSSSMTDVPPIHDVELYRDDVGWVFRVPSLRITGGAPTREEAIARCRAAIRAADAADDDFYVRLEFQPAVNMIVLRAAVGVVIAVLVLAPLAVVGRALGAWGRVARRLKGN